MPKDPLVPEDTMKASDIRMRHLYADSYKASQMMACSDFLSTVCDTYPNWVWSRPSAKQPWHWRTELETPRGYKVYVNVWPHKRKWDIGNMISGEGWDKLLDYMADALDQYDEKGAIELE